MTIRLAPASASTDAGGPGYQMSSQIVSPTRTPPISINAGRVAGLEVAALVEDAVVGQQDLAVGGADRPSASTAAELYVAASRSGKPTTATMPVDLGGDLLEGAAGGVEEVRLQPQVLGRVAGDHLLGEDHQLRAGLAGLGDPLRRSGARCPRCRPP